MSWKSETNQWLVVNSSVILTPAIDPVIVELDNWFEKAALIAKVTSGLRGPADQLRVIRDYCVKKGIEKEFPRILSCGVTDKYMLGTDSVFVWQPPWSRLLNIGIIINPPLQARVLFDYMRNGVNKRGQIINQTPHSNGTSFDIGGSSGEPGVSDELAVIKEAFDSGTIDNWKGYLVER